MDLYYITSSHPTIILRNSVSFAPPYFYRPFEGENVIAATVNVHIVNIQIKGKDKNDVTIFVKFNP